MASSRVTTRVEDMAYCLLGIFGVNMPLLYGEGTRAFTRLQEEIMKDSADQTLFAWTAELGLELPRLTSLRGPFASSPRDFRDAGHFVPYPDLVGNPPYAMTNQGLRFDIPILPYSKNPGLWLAILGCHLAGSVESPLAIIIQPVNSRTAQSNGLNQYGRFVRPLAPIYVTSEMLSLAEMKTIYLKKNLSTARSHDREYGFHMRIAKPTHPAYAKIKAKISYHSPFDHWKYAKVEGQSLSCASLETSRTVVSAMFGTSNGEYFLVGVVLTPPETYLHELDKWLRTRCCCRLIAAHGTSPEAFSADLIQNQITHGYFDSQGHAIHISETGKIVARASKDFLNGGKIIRLDIHLDGEKYGPHELAGNGQMLPIELEGSLSQLSVYQPDENEVHGEALQAALQGLVDEYTATKELRSFLKPPTASNPFERRSNASSAKSKVSTELMNQVAAQRETEKSNEDDAMSATVLGRGYFGSPDFTSGSNP
jgi:hypothetical protein